MNSKKASRSRGVRTWPVVVLRRRVLGGCACAGDRVLRGDGRGLVWLRVQVQVLGPLRGGEVGGGRCEEKDARGKRGRAPTLRGGESRTESRETHESGGGRRLLLRKTSRDAYLQKNRSERGLRGAGERCRRHRAGRSCRVGRTSRREPSKYLKISLLCRSGTRIALSNEVVISMVCRSRFPSHVTRRRVLGGAEVGCRRRPFRDNPLDQKIKKTSET